MNNLCNEQWWKLRRNRKAREAIANFSGVSLQQRIGSTLPVTEIKFMLEISKRF